MTFQSLSYWLFLPLACGLVALLPAGRVRLVAVLGLGYFFYATWGAWLPLLLLSSTLLNWAGGRLVRWRPVPWTLSVAVAANLALLCVLKYGGAWSGSIVLPVGLSFFTFQGLSHLIDTYRGDDTDPTLLELAVYMGFWPTVLSGPITRVDEVVPQLRPLRRPGWDDIACGAQRIVIGLFMKMVIADTLAQGIQVGEGVVFGFDHLAGGWSGLDAWFLAIGFGFQLYFDFAGYSSVAIGSARLLGVRVRENFDDPYLAGSPAEFWHRWHMSLSHWIRDYVFFPLATSLPRAWGRYAAVIVSMVVFGAWHGVGWTFILWGLYHGVLQVAQRLLESARRGRSLPAVVRPVWPIIAWGSTFLLVSYGWLLFRSASLTQAWALTRAIAHPLGYASFSLRPNYYLLVTLVAVLYFAYGFAKRAVVRLAPPQAAPLALAVLRPVYYGVMLVAIIIWSHQSSVFVYFQF